LRTLTEKKEYIPSCHGSFVSNIHVCVVNNGASLDLSLYAGWKTID